MGITTDKSIYTVRPKEVISVVYTVINDWHAKFGDAFLNKYRVSLKSSYYNNGDLINFAVYNLSPGYKQTGTIKLNTPSTESRYSVELRLRIKRASDGKFLTDAKTTFYIETKFDTPDVPPSPDDYNEGVPKPQIISNHTDKLGYNVGDIIKSECVIKNIDGAGTVHLKVGLGYIDSSNMIYLTGVPSTDQLFMNNGEIRTFRTDVKVDITDYYRQQGIGWAYLQQQMYLFFLVGHKEHGDIIWDTERHISIYLDEPEGFKDPTDLDESILPDIGDIIPDIGDITPDVGDVLDWAIDKITPEPKEEGEPSNLMPFLYISFMGFIGYLLMRSQ